MSQTNQAKKPKRTNSKTTVGQAAVRSASDPRAGYALAGPPPEPNLSALFDVLSSIDERESRIELSQLIRTRLRDIYPAGSGKLGTAHLQNDLHFDVDLGDLFGAEFFVGNMNETDVLNALTATLPADARTVDVGANFGLFGVHAAHVAPEGKVVALEPLPSAFDLLEKNIDQNGLSARVEAINAAVSNRGGKAKFFVATDGAFSGLRDTGRSPLLDTVNVSKIALDKCAPVQALDRIDFLKIDTEGHEAGVLAGAKDTLGRSPEAFVMLEYSHKNLTDASRVDLLGELNSLMDAGFSAVAYDDDRKVKPLSRAEDISEDTAGTIFLTGPKCRWSERFFEALRSEIKASIPSEADRSALLILSEFSKVRSQLAAIEVLNVDFPVDEMGTPLPKRISRTFARMRTDLERAETARDRLSHQAVAAEERIAAHRDHAKSVQKKLDERTAAFDAKTEAFQAKIAELGNTLKERTEALNSKVEAFQAELEKQQLRTEHAKHALEAVEADRESLKANAAVLEERLKAFRDHASSLQEKLDVRTDAWVKTVASLKSELAAHAEAKAHLETSRQLRAELRQELETSAVEKAALQAEIEMLRSDRNAMSAEIDEQRSMIRALQQLDSLHALGLGKHLPRRRGA
ncbi:FkbM family methyltransferase [Henriciella marina]|uniref:FkbM family methyltransferase n=1 Tax=Henriciella marina TaxID=453851 RepID=UPI000370310C|nr:FkbM family methyltransferase [Henriciella marina]